MIIDDNHVLYKMVQKLFNVLYMYTRTEKADDKEFDLIYTAIESIQRLHITSHVRTYIMMSW